MDRGDADQWHLGGSNRGLPDTFRSRDRPAAHVILWTKWLEIRVNTGCVPKRTHYVIVQLFS